MIFKSNSGTDHIDAFDALCRHVRASLGDAVRRAIGDTVAVLRDQDDGRLSADQQAAALWTNVSERIRAAHHRYDQLLVARLEGVALPVPIDSALFVNLLSQAISRNCPDDFASVICAAIAFEPGIGQTRGTHPFDSGVIADAFSAAVADVVNQPTLGLTEDSSLIETLGNQLADIYRSTARFAGAIGADETRDASGLPIGYDEVRESVMHESFVAPTTSTVVTPTEQVQTVADLMTDTNSSTDPDPEADTKSGAKQELSVPPRYVEQALIANEGGRELGQSVLAQDRIGSGLSQLTSLHPVADMERDAQQFAHAVGELAYSRECRGRFFEEIRKRLDSAGAAPTQLALVDLVDAMFNYAIDDRRLTDSAKPLAWRLQQPVLMLTLLDSAYMSDSRRSLRALVENFGAIAKAFGDDLTRGTELYRRLETVVRAIEIISNVLFLRGNVLARQVAIEFDRAAGGIAQLVQKVERERIAMEATPGRQNRRDYSRRPGRDQERAVTDQLSATMAAKTSGQSLPEAVHQFLDKVWLRYLRTALLRDGADSAQYQSAVGAVDELVWSLQVDEINQGRRELAQRIPRLIDRLTRGMHEIGESEDDHQAFFDELFVIHLQKLQRRRDPQASQTARRQTSNPVGSPARADATEYDVSHDVPVLEDTLDTLPDTEAMITEPGLTQANDSQSEPSTLGITETLMADNADARDGDVDSIEGNNSSDVDVDAVIDQSTGRYRSDAVSTMKPLIEIPAHRDDPHSTLMETTDLDEYTGSAAVTTQVAQPSTEVAHGSAVPASNDDSPADDPLMMRLARTDLTDLPRQPRFQGGSVDALMRALTVGTWVQMSGLNNKTVSLKVAWLSADSTTLLFVRHPDARVIAREANQIRSLIDQRRLRLIRSERLASGS